MREHRADACVIGSAVSLTPCHCYEWDAEKRNSPTGTSRWGIEPVLLEVRRTAKSDNRTDHP